MHKKNIIERLDYKNPQDNLDLYLHRRRYQVAGAALKGGLILDLGCGMGFGTKILASKMPDKKFVGIDIDRESVKYANSHNKLENVEFHLMDAAKLGFPDCYFDSVVSIENIEHVEDYQDYIKEVYRVLKPGGRLFLTTPRAGRPGKTENPYHKHEFKVGEMKGLLQQCKFKVSKIRGLYLHILPARFKSLRKFINTGIVSRILVNASFMPLNDYFSVLAQKSRKSILFIQESFFPPETGRRDILEYPLHFKKLGWDCACLVYSENKGDEEKIYDGIKIIGAAKRTKNKYVSSLLFSFGCAAHILKNRNDYSIIHAINSFRFPLIFIIAARLSAAKVVYDIRTAPIRKKDIRYGLYRVGEFLNCLFSDRVVIIDKRLAKKLRIDRLSSKITESAPGVNLAAIRRLEPVKRSDLGVSENCKIYIYSGTLDQERNLLFFVESFSKYCDGKNSSALLILGDGGQFNAINNFIEKGKIKNIHLLGKVSNEEVFAILKSCDYGVSYIPKKEYYEYQPPLKTIEYLACGLPVIATDTRGNRVFLGRENSVLVEDSAESIIRGLEEIRKIEPRIDVEEFDWLNICKRIEAVYLECLKNKVER